MTTPVCAHCKGECSPERPWTMFRGSAYHNTCYSPMLQEQQRVLSVLPKTRSVSVASVSYDTPTKLSDLIDTLEGMIIRSDDGISIYQEVPLQYAVVETDSVGSLVEVLGSCKVWLW